MQPITQNISNEQYFFNDPTMDDLATALAPFERPCLLCAPMLGRALHNRGITAAVLDTDARFADLPGFVRWDLKRPAYQDGDFDVIVCDPPFFGVSLSQLVAAVAMLSNWGGSTPLAISYLTRRESALLSAFSRFGLRPTGYFPGYRSVENQGRNEIQFYANFDSPLWPALIAAQAA